MADGESSEMKTGDELPEVAAAVAENKVVRKRVTKAKDSDNEEADDEPEIFTDVESMVASDESDAERAAPRARAQRSTSLERPIRQMTLISEDESGVQIVETKEYDEEQMHAANEASNEEEATDEVKTTNLHCRKVTRRVRSAAMAVTAALSMDRNDDTDSDNDGPPQIRANQNLLVPPSAADDEGSTDLSDLDMSDDEQSGNSKRRNSKPKPEQPANEELVTFKQVVSEISFEEN